jgi:hypothetical protein
MPFVIYAVPFFRDFAARDIAALASLPDVRVGIISQDPLERFPPQVQECIVGHWRIDDPLDSEQIIWAARELAHRHGPIHRLLTVQEHMMLPVAEARDALNLPGMNARTTRNFRDKARMKDLLRAASVPCARHALAHNEADAWRFTEEVGYPIVVKPQAGAGTVTTFRVESAEALRQALDMVPQHPGWAVLLEEFITGSEHSFETFSVNGRHVWHSLTHYLPSPLEVMQTDWIQMCGLLPREIDAPDYDDIRVLAARALDALEMDTGVSHMEWFRRADGSVAISEVAARPPGGELMTFMSRAHDFDSIDAWARLMVFGEFDPPPERRFAVGCAYLRAQGAGERIVAVHGMDDVHRELGPMVCDLKLPQVGEMPTHHYSGDGFIIVRHPETSVVRDALARVVSLVRVELG